MATNHVWFARSLENYKEMHKETAKTKGVFDAFMAATTLTAAKRILFGGRRR